jgi:hypothetical protein
VSTDARRGGGFADPAASLTAEAGLAVFRIAFTSWISAPEGPDLAQLISESLDELRAVTAGK